MKAGLSLKTSGLGGQATETLDNKHDVHCHLSYLFEVNGLQLRSTKLFTLSTCDVFSVFRINLKW